MKFRSLKTPFFTLLGFLIFAVGCTSRQGFQASNVSYIYNTRDLAPRPEFVTHHLDDATTRVFFRLNGNDILYVKNPETNLYRADFTIAYQLVRSFENTAVLDSGLVQIEDEAPQPPQKIITGSFDLQTQLPEGENKAEFVLRIVMTDQNRRVEFENFVRIPRRRGSDLGHFLLTDTAGNPLYKKHVATGAPFLVDFTGQPAAAYWVAHYRREFPVALPPYSGIDGQSFDLEPDTVYQIPADRPFAFRESGFYYFRTDTSNWDGLAVFSFYDEFPYIAKRLNLGPPLRYLTTRREYDILKEVMNDPVALKKEADDFWLRRSGSVERSRLLIESYYRRVQESNVFFTSYIEGWKTDRGIIYCIYGPPNKVYRSSEGESWVYGDETSALSYFFNFQKVSNPFTNNDYALSRSPTYRYGWGQAIEAWRNGHIYNSQDIKREQDDQRQNRYQRRNPYWY